MKRSSVFSTTNWDLKHKKLAVCIPCRDTLHSAHALNLVELVKFNTMNGIDTHVFMDASTVLLTQRERLAEMAIDLDSEYMLWLDSDIVFPATTAVRLLAHKKDIVAGNYVKRQPPFKGVAYEKIGDWQHPLAFDIKDELVKIEGIGLGCVLMKTKLFLDLPKPWFEFRYNAETNDVLGEDMILWQKLLKQNYEIFVDTQLSQELRHLGTYGFGPDNLK